MLALRSLHFCTHTYMPGKQRHVVYLLLDHTPSVTDCVPTPGSPLNFLRALRARSPARQKRPPAPPDKIIVETIIYVVESELFVCFVSRVLSQLPYGAVDRGLQ